MSASVTLEHQHRLPAHHRMLALLAVGAARLLVPLRPRQLRRVLEFLRCGARPATSEQAHRARQAVVAVSLRCAGKGCLQRSIAAALYCRARGSWPTWCTGVCVPTPSRPTPGSKSTINPSANPIPPGTTEACSRSHPPHPVAAGGNGQPITIEEEPPTPRLRQVGSFQPCELDTRVSHAGVGQLFYRVGIVGVVTAIPAVARLRLPPHRHSLA
jgi:transglutaminase superfamily protein